MYHWLSPDSFETVHIMFSFCKNFLRWKLLSKHMIIPLQHIPTTKQSFFGHALSDKNNFFDNVIDSHFCKYFKHSLIRRKQNWTFKVMTGSKIHHFKFKITLLKLTAWYTTVYNNKFGPCKNTHLEHAEIIFHKSLSAKQ